jgi:hypothetical protein
MYLLTCKESENRDCDRPRPCASEQTSTMLVRPQSSLVLFSPSPTCCCFESNSQVNSSCSLVATPGHLSQTSLNLGNCSSRQDGDSYSRLVQLSKCVLVHSYPGSLRAPSLLQPISRDPSKPRSNYPNIQFAMLSVSNHPSCQIYPQASHTTVCLGPRPTDCAAVAHKSSSNDD